MSTYPSEFVPDGPQSPQVLIETEPSRPPVGEEKSPLKERASDSAEHVSHVASEETKKVAAEAGTQARNLLNEAGEELREQAAAQQVRLAGGLRSLGSQLSEMADSSAEPGVATDLARQAADRARAIARWLEEREPGSLVDEVKSFARQRPGAFLGIAAGAGILAGRLTKALATPSSPGSSSSPSSTQPPSQAARRDMPRPDTYRPAAGTYVPGPDTYRSGDSYDR